MRFRVEDCECNRHIGWAQGKVGQVLDHAPSYAVVRPIISITYVFLGAAEWGNELMAQVAADYFASHPGKADVVCVHEHGGWFLSFLKDGTIVETANDAAVLSDKARAWLVSVKGAEREVVGEIRRQ